MSGTDSEIGLFQAMYTQRAIRHYTQEPVPDEIVRKLIEAASKAPSGANSQRWHFLVIRDTDTKRRIGEHYWQSWERAYGNQADTSPDIQTNVRSSATHLAETMAEAPVLIMACIEHDGSPGTMSRGSSIYPAVQNLLLAARGLGLGSVITTLHKRYENEIKAILDIPDNVETAALLPIGFPQEGYRYGPTRRAPVDQITSWERWGGSPPS